MKYALSTFAITVAVILVVAAIMPLFQKTSRDNSKKTDPENRAVRIKRYLKSTSVADLQSRVPASVGSLEASRFGGLLVSLKINEKAVQSPSDAIENLEAAWRAAGVRGHDKNASDDRATLIGLCQQNLAFACERYYHQERASYFEVMANARTLADHSARLERLERLKAVQARLGQFARANCLGGQPFACQDVIDQPGAGEMMNTIKSYCLGGDIDYCMTAGFALLNRWTRGQKKDKDQSARQPHLEVILDEAKTFMAKGCHAGSFEACSELIQGPLAEMTDPRSESAIEFFDRLCDDGDSTACVTVAGALYSGDRKEIAEAVNHYCELRARTSEEKMSPEERTVCARLAQVKTIDDALWTDMTGLMYEGPRLSAKVLDHLAPGRSVATP